MRKPDFFIVGAPRSGTTSLFHYLRQHPSIFIPTVKEPHFFSDYYHPNGPQLKSLDDYLELYRECGDDQLAGDLSTSYLNSPRAAGRIREFQPAAKIGIVLRNPIDRAYSFYWYNRNRFVEDLSFEEALDEEPVRIASGRNYSFHYVESGRYYGQVQRFLTAFGSESVKIYLFEELVRDSTALCRDFVTFLGLPWNDAMQTTDVFNSSGTYKSEFLGRLLRLPFPGREFLRNVAPTGARKLKNLVFARSTDRPPEMEEATRARLVQAFREDIEQLMQLLDRDLGHWLKAPVQRPFPADAAQTAP
jgi:hypothetical protein